MSKAISTIFETKDYQMFSLLEGNRTDYKERAQKIIESIKQNGYILSPICVNEKFEVVDGQGRKSALEQLGMPIHYYIAPGAGIDDCIAMNIYGTKWSILDYAESYANRGYKDYVELLKLYREHPHFSFITIVCIASGILNGRNKMDHIKKGIFKLSDADVIRSQETLNYFETVRPLIANTNGRKDYVYQALNFLTGRYYQGEFDKSRMITCLQRYGTDMLRNVVDIKSALEALSTLYNYKKKNEKVYFATEYDKAMRKCLGGYKERYAHKIESNNEEE